MIGLPAALDKNGLDKDDLNIIRNKEIKSVEKNMTEAWRIIEEGLCNGVCVCVSGLRLRDGVL
jgi:hypothetical protein